MDKITFVNGSEPALNADNLNTIQDNMETAIEESTIFDGDKYTSTITVDDTEESTFNLPSPYVDSYSDYVMVNVYIDGERTTNFSVEWQSSVYTVQLYTAVSNCTVTIECIKIKEEVVDFFLNYINSHSAQG